MKNILFITWDGAQTNYMEGLFMPIFNEVQLLKSNYKFHIIQFTWSNQDKIDMTTKLAFEYGIEYLAHPIFRKPEVNIATVFTIFKGINFIKKYIVKHNITIVIPRSTIPAVMVNRFKKNNFKLLFDADGFPLEERVDFSGLSKSSKQYRFLKQEENIILKNADGVFTRSNKAISKHLETLGLENDEKFSKVFNGRSSVLFQPNSTFNAEIRKGLNSKHDTKIFVYCGSLGDQYGWNEMISIFKKYHLKNTNSKFLILTGNIEYAKQRIPDDLSKDIILLNVPFDTVPNYLSVADVAFAIREPKPSMQGVSPIKLGEYLLMGIPTIASKGIGDTEELLIKVPNCFLFDHSDVNINENAVNFVLNLKIGQSQEIRNFGIAHFSLEKSAESYINAIEKL